MNDNALASHDVSRLSSVAGNINYMAESVEPSLFRNGKLLTRRDRDGSDGEFIGMVVDKRPLQINNARELEPAQTCTLAQNGFDVCTHPLDDTGLDFLDHERVVTRYYQSCAELVKQMSGARTVKAFDHNVRSASGKQRGDRVAGGQRVQGPARLVHGDYTLTSAPARLRDLARPPGENDTLRSVLAPGETLLDSDHVEQAISSGRFAIINVWRNIRPEPVAVFPMALCDGKTVAPSDLSVFEIHYADRIGENYFARYAPDHRWYYYPGLRQDEALLIKQWDSAGPLARSDGAVGDNSVPSDPCSFSFHTAFRDPGVGADAPDRWSIEVRCVAIF